MRTKRDEDKLSSVLRIGLRPADRELIGRAVKMSGGRGELSDFGRAAILKEATAVLSISGAYPHCHAGRDGECCWPYCPQLRDGEPEATGRHCPLDHEDEEA